MVPASKDDMLEDHATRLGDVEFLTVIAIRRTPFEFEAWRDGGLVAAKLALRSMFEFQVLNAPDDRLIEPALDKIVPPDPSVVARAFALALHREPSAQEMEALCTPEGISLSTLSRHIFSSYEAFAIDGLLEQADPALFDQRQNTTFLLKTYDIFASIALRALDTPTPRRSRGFGIAAPRFRIALNIFAVNDDGLEGIRNSIESRHGLACEIETVTSAEVVRGTALDGFDLYVTNNNYLYHDTDAHFAAVRDSDALSVCWLWDNHHQYDFSSKITSAFDVVFPAHSNGQSYLRCGTAVVGSPIPCCTFQWQAGEAAALFATVGDLPADDRLYGRFNSYAGRFALRDVFLRQVSREISDAVAVVPASQNDWAGRSSEDRFRAIARHKAVLCNPIFNDIPCRVFDALLCGSVAVLPYGLPDLHGVFGGRDMDALGIVLYLENDLASLRRAVERAVGIYDKGGQRGRLDRHESIMKSHLMEHRLSQMISEAIYLKTAV